MVLVAFIEYFLFFLTNPPLLLYKRAEEEMRY